MRTSAERLEACASWQETGFERATHLCVLAGAAPASVVGVGGGRVRENKRGPAKDLGILGCVAGQPHPRGTPAGDAGPGPGRGAWRTDGRVAAYAPAATFAFNASTACLRASPTLS